METMVIAKTNSRELQLHYSVSTMFEVIEKYGSAQEAINQLLRDDETGFECLRFLTIALANDAELCRREAGLAEQPMLSETDITPRMSPEEYGNLKAAVCEAIKQGYQLELTNTAQTQ